MLTSTDNGAPGPQTEAESAPVVIGIRYCGGCNPRYDRGAQARRFLQSLTSVRFTMVRPGETYAAILLICGCETACATVTDLPPVRLLYVRSVHEADQVLRALRDR